MCLQITSNFITIITMKSIFKSIYYIYKTCYLQIIQDINSTIPNKYLSITVNVWVCCLITLALTGISFGIYRVFIVDILINTLL